MKLPLTLQSPQEASHIHSDISFSDLAAPTEFCRNHHVAAEVNTQRAEIVTSLL